MQMNTWTAEKDSMKHHCLTKNLFSTLNMEDVTDVDCKEMQKNPKKVYKEFNDKNVGDYHDLYVKSHTLLLADVFGNFRNKCIEIYELDPPHFLPAPGLAWQACLK